MRIYVAGPMSGIPCYTFPAFDACAAFLRSQNHEVISPAEHDREVYPNIAEWPGYASGNSAICPEFNLHQILAWDLQQVASADAVVFLPGWELSAGALHERYVAKATGKRIGQFYWPDAVIWHEPPLIIGICGAARSGKDSVAASLVHGHGFIRRALADPLRSIAEGIDPLLTDHASITTAHLSSLLRNGSHEDIKHSPYAADYRRFLQRLGTEGIRAAFGPSFWVDQLFKWLDFHPDCHRLVVPDVRFNNEAQAIRKAGGTIWLVERPGTAFTAAHPSEGGINDEFIDSVIFNGSTRTSLALTVDRLFDEVKRAKVQNA